MSAFIIDGKKISEEIRREVKESTLRLKTRTGIVPGLAFILVGEDPASQSYVKSKGKACEELNFYSVTEKVPASITEAEILSMIEAFNYDPKIHGILVQLPLPKHINEQRIIEAISPDKDVDGFHPISAGRMMVGAETFYPCTPAGILELLKRSSINPSGKHVVVAGRSNIVGKPIANILMQKNKGANATVTLCHTHTRDIAFHTRRADILIVAAGKPKSITAAMVKEGAVVIDVGVNQIGTSRSGKRILVGDVDFENVKEKASMITPVPGGVGPMTITMLMLNTLKAAKIAVGLV